MNRMFKEHMLLKVGSLFIKLNGQGKQHTRIQAIPIYFIYRKYHNKCEKLRKVLNLLLYILFMNYYLYPQGHTHAHIHKHAGVHTHTHTKQQQQL